MDFIVISVQRSEELYEATYVHKSISINYMYYDNNRIFY